MHSRSQEQRARLLQFVTGTARLPAGGFAALQGNDGVVCPFTLLGLDRAHRPEALRAHTCFNQLDLPEYSSEEETRAKLLLALREGSEGFGFG